MCVEYSAVIVACSSRSKLRESDGAAWDIVRHGMPCRKATVPECRSREARTAPTQRRILCRADSEEGKNCMPALQLIDLLMLLAELRFRVIQLCPESAHLAAAKCGTAKRVHAQRSAFLPEPRAGGTQDLLNQVPPKRPCQRELAHGNHAQV
jgi:hypothetical protein